MHESKLRLGNDHAMGNGQPPTTLSPSPPPLPSTLHDVSAGTFPAPGTGAERNREVIISDAASAINNNLLYLPQDPRNAPYLCRPPSRTLESSVIQFTQ